MRNFGNQCKSFYRFRKGQIGVTDNIKVHWTTTMTTTREDKHPLRPEFKANTINFEVDRNQEK